MLLILISAIHKIKRYCGCEVFYSHLTENQSFKTGLVAEKKMFKYDKK